MRSLNQVTLLGHCGKTPDVNPKQSRLRFSLATTNRFKREGADTSEQQTDWHDVVVFGQPSIQFLAKHLTRGQPVFVRGRLRSYSVTHEQKTWRCWEVIADDVIPLPKSTGHEPAVPEDNEA